MKSFGESHLRRLVDSDLLLQEFNQEAFRTTLAFLNEPRTPLLVLIGGVGNGKSHLLASVLAKAHAYDLERSVFVASGDQEIHLSEVPGGSLLIIESVDLPLRRGPVELGHLLHELCIKGCKVILTCSRSENLHILPAHTKTVIRDPNHGEIAGIAARVRTRLGLRDEDLHSACELGGRSLRHIEAALLCRALARSM